MEGSNEKMNVSSKMDVSGKMEEVERCLRKLTIEELETVALSADLDAKIWETQTDANKKRKIMLRAIEDTLEDVDEAERLETVKSLLLPMLPERIAKELDSGLFTEKAPFAEGLPIRKTNEESGSKLSVSPPKSPPSLKKEGMRTNDGADNFESSRANPESMNSSMTDKMDRMMETVMILKHMGLDGSSTSALRREFKISGSIGTSHKDSLTYIGLCSQIKDGISKGYKEKEILSAIRNATPAGSTLRTYLDTKNDRSLENVKNFIRHYLKEKGTTELFHEMTTLGQHSNEDAQTFILRALELREKVRVASENENPVSLDPKLIQSMFVRQVITGLTDDAVRYKLEPLLRREASDEELLKEVNQVMSEEAERRFKRGEKADASHTKVKAAEVKTGLDQATANAMSEAVAPLMQKMEEMAAKMNEMEKEISKYKAGSVKQQQPQQRSAQQNSQQQRPAQQNRPARASYPRGCEACITANAGDSCTHCWRCGSDTHKSFGCNLRRRNPPSN